MKTISRILLILLGLFLIALAVFLIIHSIRRMGDIPEEKIVKCYDKFGNEILGQECKEIENIDMESGFGIALSFWMIIGGISIVCIQINRLREKK
ncbi:MAG TPA: hypothetical protein VMZ91_12930 [Candidatus Paceibacterota bacterium]|nr:hypothetical protein [Candidatus Paceibacterota bacterium]